MLPLEKKKDSTSSMDKSEKTEKKNQKKNGNMLKEVSQLMEKIETLTTHLNKKEEALKDQTFKLEKLSRKMQEKEVYFKEKVKSFEEKQLSYQDQYDSLYSKYIVKTQNSTSLAKKYKKLKADLEVMSKEKQNSNESICNVCLTDPKNTVLVPCGHCFCVDCVGALCARDNTQCPVCRQEFRECVKFFM